MEMKYDDEIFGAKISVEKLRKDDAKFHMFDSLEEVLAIVIPILEIPENKNVFLIKKKDKIILNIQIQL